MGRRFALRYPAPNEEREPTQFTAVAVDSAVQRVGHHPVGALHSRQRNIKWALEMETARPAPGSGTTRAL